MADQNLLCTNGTHGFETQQLAEAKGSCIPRTSPGRDGAKGSGAKDPKDRVAPAAPALPSWATFSKGLDLSGSDSFSEN